MFVKIFLIIAINITLFLAAKQDFKTQEADSKYSYIIFAISFVYALIQGNLKHNLIVFTIIFIIFYLIYLIEIYIKREGFGGADVRILSALAMYYGNTVSILFLILFACAFNLIYSIFYSFKTKKTFLNSYWPFIPFIFLSNIFISFLEIFNISILDFVLNIFI